MSAAHRLALLACLVGLGCGSGESAPAGEAPPLEPAPDFTLPDLAGSEITLSDFRGRTVLVDFWATWCPPCEFQVPELNRLAEAHEAAGDLVVIGVSVDVDGAEVVAPWVEEKDVRYPVVLGDEGLARSFGVAGFPTMALVTPAGEIHSLHVGLVEYDELEAIVREVAERAQGSG